VTRTTLCRVPRPLPPGVYGPVTDIVETFTKYLGALLASFPYEPEEELTKEAESAFVPGGRSPSRII